MANYVVTASVKLNVQANDEAEAKQKAMEELSDFLRHNSFDSLMKVKKQRRGQS